MGRVVPDSSVWISLNRQGLVSLIDINEADDYYLPAVVYAEIITPALDSSRSLEQRQFTRDFSTAVLGLAEFVPINQKIGEIYAELALFCRRSGKPRGANDLWIAATSIFLDAELLTLDQKAGFESLPGLMVRF